MGNSVEPVRIDDVVCIRQTAKAILVVIEDVERWIPQSAIHDDSEVWQDGDKGELVVAGWFAEKVGL